MKRKQYNLCWFLVIVAVLSGLDTTSSESLSKSSAINANPDIGKFMPGHHHYKPLVWDPRTTTNAVYNISSTNPLDILLIRKNIGKCEMFFLKFKALLVLNVSGVIIACIGELSENNFEQKCEWVNNSETLSVEQGNIYGMPSDCGPWYLTVYVPDAANMTLFSVQVSDPYDPLFFRWFRVITNIAFIPGIYLAFKRGFYAEGIVYFLNFCLSCTYHLCEAELHCFKGYDRLHISDMYVSDLSIIVTVWTLSGIKPPLKHLIFLAIAIVLQFAVTETVKSTYHFFLNLVFSIVPFVYIFSKYLQRSVKYRSCYPGRKRWMYHLIPGFSLALTGALVNLIVSGNDNYYYVHCIWHLTIMLSVAFLLPTSPDDDLDEMWWNEKAQRATYAALT